MTTIGEPIDIGVTDLVPMDSKELQGNDNSVSMVTLDQYGGLGVTPFSKQVQDVLNARLTDDEIAVRPDDGELYVPGVIVRQKLFAAFGVGGWGMKPISIVVDKENKNKKGEQQPKVYYTGHLICLGRFVAEATGEGNWIVSNPKSDYGTALESAKTNCIMRCAKDLGLGWQLWDKSFTEPWKQKHCINVGGEWKKRPPQPVKPAVNVPPPRAGVSGGVGAMPVNKEHEDKGRELREQYAAVMGSAVPPPDPEENVKFRKSDRQATVKDLERTLEKTLPEVELNRDMGGGLIEVTARDTGEKHIEEQRTADQNARIHVLRAELGYDKGSGEKDYRHALWTYYRVRSSKLLTVAQASNLIERLEKSQRNLNR